MTLSITLSPSGGLRLILPTGRILDLGSEPSAIQFVLRILRNAAEYDPANQRRGHIGEFPTQHVIEIWKKQARQAQADAVREDFAAKGIDVGALDIQL